MNYTNSNQQSITAYELFSVFSVVFSACLFSFSVVGSTLYSRVGDDNYNHNNFFSDSDKDSDSDSDSDAESDADADADDEDEDEEYTQEKYARLYYDELNDLEDRVLDKDDLEKLGTIVIKEKTPNGNVIMTYNNKSESFCYYCDDKNIRYMILDTVARKFTIDNKCKSICVNYKAEFEKAKAAIIADTKTSTVVADDDDSIKEPPVVKKSIYARFKNYNAPPQKKKVDEDKKPEKIYILTEKANRFTYKGKLSNYKDPNEVVTTFFNKTVDFATFKKLCAENANK
jgi:hypothetical protein